MRCTGFPAALLILSFSTALVFGADEEPAIEHKESLGLPKVPSRAAIAKDGEGAAKISLWIQNFIDAKEKKAYAELETLKKNARAEEETRLAAEKERRRRQDKYDQSWGTVGASEKNGKRANLRLKLQFQIVEIDTYRNLADTNRALQAVANDIAQGLSGIDRDGDGKLSGDEYRDAASIVVSTRRLFQAIDGNNDGMITEEELETARRVPPNLSAAIRAGREGASVANFKIKPYDVDGNGVLDVDERKALTTAFVELAVRLGSDADFYKSIADNLSKAREIVAAKFADVEVTP